MPAAFIGLLILTLLFFKLPGVPELFGILNCKSCQTTTPYLPMVAAAYFAAFVTCVLCFPTLPSRPLKYGGIVWALSLAISLTYLSTQLCWICLVAHLLHLSMWLLWKPKTAEPEQAVNSKLALVFTSALAMMALFSTLNVTFLVYGLKFKNPTSFFNKFGKPEINLTPGRKERRPHVLKHPEIDPPQPDQRRWRIGKIMHQQ